MTTIEQQQPRKYSREGAHPRGFATMSPEKKREIASKGGKTAHKLGTAHEWKPGEEASEAGKKGGTVSRRGPKNKEA